MSVHNTEYDWQRRLRRGEPPPKDEPFNDDRMPPAGPARDAWFAQRRIEMGSTSPHTFVKGLCSTSVFTALCIAILHNSERVGSEMAILIAVVVWIGLMGAVGLWVVLKN